MIINLSIVIHCKHIYNFDAPCLFYTNYLMFYLCFGALFMHFLELTYWQDATVPVPVFCCFWFQKSYIGNILGIGRDKNQCSYFYRAETEVWSEVEEGSQAGHTMPRSGPGLGRAWHRCGGPAARLWLSFGLLCCHGKVMTSGFCPVQFREYFLCRISETKNSRKQELALRHLVNRLVPENA